MVFPTRKAALVVTGPGYPQGQHRISREGLLELGYNVIHLVDVTDDEQVLTVLREEAIRVFVFSGHGFNNGLRVAEGNEDQYADWLTQDEIHEARRQYYIDTGEYSHKATFDFVMLNACATYFPNGYASGESQYDAALAQWESTCNANALVGWTVDELDYGIGGGFEKEFWDAATANPCARIKQIRDYAWGGLTTIDGNDGGAAEVIVGNLRNEQAVGIYDVKLTPDVNITRLSPYRDPAQDLCNN